MVFLILSSDVPL